MTTLTEARQQGDLFAQRAFRKASNADPTFGARARAFIVAHLKQHGPTSGEILTNACERSGIKPRDSRAFGAVYAKLIRDRQITILRADLPRYKGHGSAGARLYGLMNP